MSLDYADGDHSSTVDEGTNNTLNVFRYTAMFAQAISTVPSDVTSKDGVPPVFTVKWKGLTDIRICRSWITSVNETEADREHLKEDWKLTIYHLQPHATTWIEDYRSNDYRLSLALGDFEPVASRYATKSCMLNGKQQSAHGSTFERKYENIYSTRRRTRSDRITFLLMAPGNEG